MNFNLDYLKYRKDRREEDEDEEDGMVLKEEEKRLKQLIVSTKEPTDKQSWTVDDIMDTVTAKNLCSCRDPIKMAFKVNFTLRKLADTCIENTELLSKLAAQTEDFAVELIGQVNSKEELVIRDAPENVDRYASLLSGMTDDAIVHSQKKFVSHPLLYKRLKMRWNLGLPDVFKHQGKFRVLLFLFILLDTVLTPILLPMIGFAFYRDQQQVQ